MISFERFTFNTFQVNTYLLWDETGEALIIDAACSDTGEKKELSSYIREKKLKLVRNVNTHCHIDHVLGNGFIFSEYRIRPGYHRAGLPFFITAKEIAASFGYALDAMPEPAGYLEEGKDVTFGKSLLKVFYTPGHADGSVCFYNPSKGFVVTGDVLFRDTIGRTDLPSGNFDLLMRSIKDKLFTLPPETIVLPGHGPDSTIGYEMGNNPFIR